MPDFKKAFSTCLLLGIVRENSIVNAQWEMQFEVRRHIANIITLKRTMGLANIPENSSNTKFLKLEFLQLGCNMSAFCQPVVTNLAIYDRSIISPILKN